MWYLLVGYFVTHMFQRLNMSGILASGRLSVGRLLCSVRYRTKEKFKVCSFVYDSPAGLLKTQHLTVQLLATELLMTQLLTTELLIGPNLKHPTSNNFELLTNF